MRKAEESNIEYIILNEVLQGIDKHISYKGYSYRPMFVKMDHYGYDRSFQGFYARESKTGLSTVNYLFKVGGSDFNEMMRKFLITYQKLIDEGYISHSTPRNWCYKCIKLEY